MYGPLDLHYDAMPYPRTRSEATCRDFIR